MEQGGIQEAEKTSDGAERVFKKGNKYVNKQNDKNPSCGGTISHRFLWGGSPKRRF